MKVRDVIKNRKAKNISEVGIASRLGISRQAVHRMFNRDLNKVAVGTLKRYAKAADVEVKISIP